MPPDEQDPYLHPGSDVLRNKPGLRSASALTQHEYECSAWRLEEVRRWPAPRRFDLDALKRIHGHVFRDVYDWAGSIRTVDMVKGGHMFRRPDFIESEGRRLADALAREDCLRGLGHAAFVHRLAECYGDWNALHPFRDGNGRATREFFRQLALLAGYDFDPTKIERDAWISASARSFEGDSVLLRGVLATAVRPRGSG